MKKNNNLKRYFVEDYKKAREKFKEYSKNLEKKEIEIKKGLKIDISYSKKNNKTLVIFLTGVHGVEGYIGSGLLNIFLDRYYKKLKNKFDFLFIHSLNPYGYKNNRRVNENNVDLNRNCLDNYNIKIDNKSLNIITKSQFVIGAKRPRKFNSIKNTLYYFYLIKNLIVHGPKNTIKALTLGQNKFPTSIFYSGNKKQKSIRVFEDILKKYTKEYENCILIDIHTGIGRKYTTTSFTNNTDKNNFKILKKIEKNLKKRNQNKDYGSDHIGSIGNLFLKKSFAKKNLEITYEFGTVSVFSKIISTNHISHKLISENQITHFGPRNKLKKARKKLKRSYYPKDYAFKFFVYQKTKKISKALDKLFFKL